MVKILREREIKWNNREIQNLKQELDKEETEKSKLEELVRQTKHEWEEYDYYIVNIKQQIDKLPANSKEYFEKKADLAKKEQRFAELNTMLFEIRDDIEECEECIETIKCEIKKLKHDNALKRGTVENNPVPKHKRSRIEKLLPEFGVIC